MAGRVSQNCLGGNLWPKTPPVNMVCLDFHRKQYKPYREADVFFGPLNVKW